MGVYNCEIEISKILSEKYGNPLYTDLKNYNYTDPGGTPGNFMVIIDHNSEEFDFSKHLVPQNTKIVKRMPGQNGYAEFLLDDSGPVSNNPLRLAKHLHVQIWNRNRTQLYFRGFVFRHPKEDMSQRENGTIACQHRVTLSDLTSEMDRRRVNEVYEGVTWGFVLVDVFQKYAPYFDVSEVPTTGADAGELIGRQGFVYKTVTQVVNAALSANPGWTFYIDEEVFPKPKVYIGPRDTLGLVTEINETNVWDLVDFGTFDLEPDDSLLRNVIHLFYTERYDLGTVDVFNGGIIIYGNGTNWFKNVDPGATIQVTGSASVYTIVKNPSTADGTVEELHLSSAFQEANATNLTYVVKGSERSIEETDDNSINLMKMVKGDDGIYAAVVEDYNLIMTEEEARRFARSLLIFANPLLNGGFKTDNTKFYFPKLQAGKTIRVNLPTSKEVTGTAVINEIVISDRKRGGYIALRNGYEDPNISLSFDLTDREIIEVEKWRAILAARQNIAVNDDRVIRYSKKFNDHIFMKLCANIIAPLLGVDTLAITEGTVALHESLQAVDTWTMTGDQVTIAAVDISGTFKTAPGSGGRTLSVIGASGYGKTAP